MKNLPIRLAVPNIQVDSIVDGEGLRSVIWTQGCPHDCPGCHNPQTHDPNKGVLTDTEEIEKQIDDLKNQDGITFSGGDPMFQAKACSVLAEYAKNKGYNVWCYTGYLYEECLKDKDMRNFLNFIDILVDGKFIIAKKSFKLKFKGSSNQRIIDVPNSIKSDKVILVNYNTNFTEQMYKKPSDVFI